MQVSNKQFDIIRKIKNVIPETKRHNYDVFDIKVVLEFEKDDVIEYYFSGAPLKRNQWPVSPEEVEEMADEEEGEIYFGGKTFYYEDDYKVKFSRASNPEKEEKAYMYEFETDNGESLTYEKWDKNDFEVYFSKPIDRVEIVCLGGE